MCELLLALGRGVVKVLISVFVGTGVGLLTFGLSVKDKPEVWERRDPPGEMFLAVGAGLLSTGGLMTALFYLPRSRNTRPTAPDKIPIQDDLSG
jgi:hypothetical protein